jgi:hypothetical protein
MHFKLMVSTAVFKCSARKKPKILHGRVKQYSRLTLSYFFFFLGILAPDSRALDKAIAIA